MIIRHVLALLTGAFICSCSGKSGSENDTANDTVSTGQHTEVTATNQCFAHHARKDSAFLHLEIAGNSVSGKLSYALFEKDRNSGTIAGTITGDTIFARYTFASEGTKSIREVAFLKKETGWVEGFGEVTDSAGVMIFTDRSKLDFEKGLHFEPVECPAAP
ncbi:hypothetical protein SAMN05216327_101569 [Dyadobacter sp. SG02]|uniref:hypothetical protein n=1 Tax=Dyadobacter sp. SG02 TaxID=1855291 RepID=UPI0008C73B82|nr:hypothetical protein [Dyadobacter sp. SG02]SEI43807.1 hypothetical protein SAMN05216327_101569 [Dyadobacter sp. SG02]